MPELMAKFGGFPRPDPVNFDLGQPEVRAVPNRAKAADLGLTADDLGFIVRACVDGAYVGEYWEQGDSIDLTLMVDETQSAMTREIASIPIYTPAGSIVPLSSVVEFVNTTAPQQINHIEEQPAIQFSIQVPETMPLQAAMDVLQDEIIVPMRESGMIGPGVVTALAGNADKLIQTRQALFGEWTGFNLDSLANLVQSRGFLALLVTYLLMAALFESYAYPLVILFSVPLATLGGFASLGMMHRWTVNDPFTPTQQLDVLTMLGFIMLIGIVVNNAILLVHQALNFMRAEKMPYPRAIVASVRTRVRPIFMTALTTMFGQLPLVILPGAGSELYRGIGSVLIGGLLVSTVFTLILVPAVFSAALDAKRIIANSLLRREPARMPARPAPLGTSDESA
jgi:HAE1 family hydrophobic/amphiphilic exporter-1